MPTGTNTETGLFEGLSNVAGSAWNSFKDLGPIQEALHPIEAIKGQVGGLYKMFNEGVQNILNNSADTLLKTKDLADQLDIAKRHGDAAQIQKIQDANKDNWLDLAGKLTVAPEAYKQSLAAQIAQKGPPETATEQLALQGRAAYDAAGRLIPISEIWQSMTGYDMQGNKMTSKQIGEMQAKAGMKIAALYGLKAMMVDPLVGAFKGAAEDAAEGAAAGSGPAPTGRIITKAEILGKGEKVMPGAKNVTPEAPSTAAAAAPEEPAGFAGAAPEAQTPAPAPNPDFAAQFARDGLANPKIQELLNHSVADALVDKVEPGTRFFKLVGKQIAAGNIPASASQDIMVAAMRTGMSLEEATQEYANVYMESVSSSAKVLQMHQQLAAGMEKTLSDMGPAGVQALAKWKQLTGKAVEPNIWSTVNEQIVKPAVQLWRAGVISGPRTAAKIGEQHLLNGVGKFYEDSMANTIEAASQTLGQAPVVGKYLFGEGVTPRPYSDIYADTVGDFLASYHSLTPKGRQYIGDILNELPQVKAQLEGARSLQEFMPAAVKGAVLDKPWLQRGADAVSNVLTFAHQIAQVETRRWFFDAQLYGKLNDVGVKYEDVLSMLKSGWEGVPEAKVNAVKAAIESAKNTALGETLSLPANPNSFMGHYIALANKYPLMFPLGPLGAFPRLLANQFRWIGARSPHLMLDFFDQETREALANGAKDAWASGEAAHSLAKGMAGMTYLALAWVMQNSDMAGPTYNTVWTGERDKDGNPRYIDISGYHPMPMYMAIARAAWDKMHGLASSISGKDLMDLFAGVKNYKATGIYAIPSILDSLKDTAGESASSRVSDALQRVAGQLLSGYLIPPQWMYQVWRGGEQVPGTAPWLIDQARGVGKPTGPNPIDTLRDVTGNELLGPSKAKLPVLAETLPPRVSVFNGEVIRNDQPVRHQVYADAAPMTKLEQQIRQTPNLSERDLVPYYNNAKLQNYVNAKLGFALKTSGFGDKLANVLGSEPDPDKKKFLLDKLIQPWREAAEQEAERALPLDMMEYRMKHQPKMLQNAITPTIKKIKTAQEQQKAGTQ